MAEVQEVRFLGINITRDGIQKIVETAEKKEPEAKKDSEVKKVELSEIEKEEEPSSQNQNQKEKLISEKQPSGWLDAKIDEKLQGTKSVPAEKVKIQDDEAVIVEQSDLTVAQPSSNAKKDNNKQKRELVRYQISDTESPAPKK